MEIRWKMERNPKKLGKLRGKKSKCFLTAVGLQPRLSTKSPHQINSKSTELTKCYQMFLNVLQEYDMENSREQLCCVRLDKSA